MLNGKYPFLYRKNDPDTDAWFVKIAQCIDYVFYDSKWMNSPELGRECLVPDVDICESVHEFASEAEAIQFIADWWKAGKGEK